MITCPSPGCKYAGVMAIHILNVSTCTPKGHMTSGEMIQTVADTEAAEKVKRERDSIILEADIPVSLFTGMPVSRIFRLIFEKLNNLLTYSERLGVRRGDGTILVHSPYSAMPSIPTAIFTMRWPSAVQMKDELAFWTLINSRKSIQQAEEIRMIFPNHVEVVLKDRVRRMTDDKFVPVP
jgi:hypothetical protein